MEYFVYGRDRAGGYEIKVRLAEPHWTFMDGYADRLIARGPTLTEDSEEAETTGSLHIVELADVDAARAFAYDEPYYRAGAFESVLLYGFRRHQDRTMWDFTGAVQGYGRFLVLTTDEPSPTPDSEHLILSGDLLALDTGQPIGRAALVEAPDAATAATVLAPTDPRRTDVHHWRFGGRPTLQ
ncbi:YCII-related protein [Kribbella flavida DSM 17836]|uniref:YCII-related protein n=1 Tax=Kribbella flavida (strain DSM 17836 / JCM 10339 / NBRC 14399) TaxID=479435 RepID=D2PT88_KRIFD|nr:YciI family protein [Kribbella flavida]ADB29404.1 YCII-related protein [Kribbella flavida DSM 17836]